MIAIQDLAARPALRFWSLALLGSAVLAASAQVSLPMWPVPATLQTLAVLLLGALGGSRLGAAAAGPAELERMRVGLRELERLGHVEARWEVATSGRRRKYYGITSRGRAQLADEHRQWQAVDETLRGIWRTLALPAPANHVASTATLPQGA